jgi:hypothetical protein
LRARGRRSRPATREAGKPVLAVDVDGVISLFGFEDPPQGLAARFELIDGVAHCIPAEAGERLRRLARHYDLVWATGWEGSANQLCELLGIPELPYLTFAGAARFGSAHWKLEPLGEYARGRPLAWIDDSFDESCYEWARGREEPTLLIPTESERGLEETQVEALTAWARSLAIESAGPA